ncbi:hypothetical protein WT77_30270 [Burkholderia stagnalis]|nr:hypothetical protein WT77_30270 [Burkholderia stagnalis]
MDILLWARRGWRCKKMKCTMCILKAFRLDINAHCLHDRTQESIVTGVAPFRIPIRNFLLECIDCVQYVGRRHER